MDGGSIGAGARRRSAVWTHFQLARKTQFAGGESLPQRVQELATKQFRQRFDGEKEGITRLDPARAVKGKSAFRNHAMHVRMMFQLLIPGVEDAEKANLSSQQSWVAGQLEQGRSAESE
jgi:hypothetical protein